jgi:hypothetical protein
MLCALRLWPDERTPLTTHRFRFDFGFAQWYDAPQEGL